MKKLKLKLLKILYKFCIHRQEAYERYADKLDDEIIKINASECRMFQTMKPFYDTITLDIEAAKRENKLFPQRHNLKGSKIEWRKFDKFEL